MSLVRTYILLFIAGWALWLWLDKAGTVQQAPAQPPPQQYYEEPAPAAPAAAPADDMLDQLERLGQLRASGVLTEEEFAAQKARILAG